MRPNLWQNFRLKIKQVTATQSCIVETLETKIGENKFTYPATNHRAKLYLVKYKNKIVYVGITAQPIANRLRSGLKSEGKHGYHGYHWKSLDQVDLMVWSDWGRDKPDKKKLMTDLKNMETIEGEVVYLVRNISGKWPEHQTEIHFHNSTEQQKKQARAIFIIAKGRH